MAQLQLTPGAMAVAGAAVLGLGYLAWKTRNLNAEDLASGAVSGALGLVGSAASGTVLGIGDALGVPRTSAAQCKADLAAGRTWDASFSCPAGTFISKGLFGWGDDSDSDGADPKTASVDRALRTAEQQPATWGSEGRRGNQAISTAPFEGPDGFGFIYF